MVYHVVAIAYYATARYLIVFLDRGKAWVRLTYYLKSWVITIVLTLKFFASAEPLRIA